MEPPDFKYPLSDAAVAAAYARRPAGFPVARLFCSCHLSHLAAIHPLCLLHPQTIILATPSPTNVFLFFLIHITSASAIPLSVFFSPSPEQFSPPCAVAVRTCSSRCVPSPTVHPFTQLATTYATAPDAISSPPRYFQILLPDSGAISNIFRSTFICHQLRAPRKAPATHLIFTIPFARRKCILVRPHLRNICRALVLFYSHFAPFNNLVLLLRYPSDTVCDVTASS